MAEVFRLAEEIHHRGDLQCPGCSDDYPERCQCGGLIHAAGTIAADEPDAIPTTRCDGCGRSEEDLQEVA